MYNLEDAKKILNKEYISYFEKVKGNDIAETWCKEKIEHSYDVLRVGVDIIKSELSDGCDVEFEEMQFALLLHDIGRFEEVYRRFYKETKSKHHGVIGYNILRDNYRVENLPILIAVKCHGFLSDEVYKDNLYTDIKNKIVKEKSIKYLELVRDADKVANIGLFSKNPLLVHKINTVGFDNRLEVTDKVYNNFISCNLIDYKNVETYSDYMLFFLAWIFDFNFKSSFKYIIDNGSFEDLLNATLSLMEDEKQKLDIEKIAREFVGSKI